MPKIRAQTCSVFEHVLLCEIVRCLTTISDGISYAVVWGLYQKELKKHNKNIMRNIAINSNLSRRAIQEVAGGAQLANTVTSMADGTVLVPDILPTRKAYGPFGFSHLGNSKDESVQFVIVGDTDGLIAAALGLTATAYDTPIGCGANAALNKQLDNEPVVVSKISLEYSDLTQKGLAIRYAVINPDGQVEVKDIAPLIQSQLDSGKFQALIDNASFAGVLKLGPTSGLIFTVGDTKTLKAIHHPSVSRR